MKALDDVIRDDCTAHLTNTVVKSSLTVTVLELQQRAVKDNARVLEIVEGVEEIARAVKGVKAKAKTGPIKRLQDAIHLPRPHLAAYVGMLQSVSSHKDKVSSHSLYSVNQ